MSIRRERWERRITIVSNALQVVAIFISFLLAAAFHKGNQENARVLAELTKERAAVQLLLEQARALSPPPGPPVTTGQQQSPASAHQP